MDAKEQLSIIQNSICNEYLYLKPQLEELQENMIVPLDKEKDVVVIKLKDDERNSLWSCFSEKVDRNVADYLIFKTIDNEIVCFILELKKSKTPSNVDKASKQITSTHPLAKMIFEKSTSKNAKDLKTIGIKVFGTGDKNQQKIKRGDERLVPQEISKDDELFAIGHFIQKNRGQRLTSLEHFYKDVKSVFRR